MTTPTTLGGFPVAAKSFGAVCLVKMSDNVM